MKLVVLSPEFPYPPTSGGRIRIYQLLKNLARLGVEVVLFSFSVEPVGSEMVKKLEQEGGFTVRYFHTAYSAPGSAWGKRLVTAKAAAKRSTPYVEYFQTAQFYRALERELSDHVDAVQVEFSYLSPYVTWIKRKFPDIPVILDAHNVESDAVGALVSTYHNPVQRWLKARSHQRLVDLELRAFQSADAIFCTSRVDGGVIKRMAGLPDEPVVVSNGVDTDYFKLLPKTDLANHTLIFSGQISHVPNEQGLVWFYEHVYQLIRQRVDDVQFLIVGRDPTPRIRRMVAHDKSVEVTGLVEDIRPYYQRAAAAVVPIQLGGGTRLKILDALAMGRPVVSTSKGAEGLGVRSDQELLMADNAESFAASIARLLYDQKLSDRLTIAGRKLVEEQYGWPAIAGNALSTYRNLVEE